ncbi:hypothetical protein HPB51_021811 [Rhipicephalus microplus]|uniref:Sex-determining region Y protein n=1 Tax=Rhipicephalus microplus TaxID=6941 RepID=A0A9J6DJN7_RHIMP|nr:hypothetical protein HPB51_021811 [Rhipicephalus microplus]
MKTGLGLKIAAVQLALHLAVYTTLVDEEDDSSDDDSSVASLPFDNGGFLDSFRSMDGAAGDGQQLSSAAVSAAAEGHPIFPEAAATAATEFTTPPDEVQKNLEEPCGNFVSPRKVAIGRVCGGNKLCSDVSLRLEHWQSPTDLGMAGPSMSSGVQHGYHLRWRIPRPPNAFMLFAQEKRRSVAAENPNENNQHVSTRLGKLWRSLSAADREPYQRKAAEAAAIHRRKYPDYVYNPREARRLKEMQARIVKSIAGKLKESPSADPAELEASSTSASQRPSTPEFQQLPPPPQSPPPLPHRLRRRESATRASTLPDGLTTPTGRPTAAMAATASARLAAWPYCVSSFVRRIQTALPRPLRRFGAATSHQPPTTYPLNQLNPLVACSRDCAAVPHPQVNGPGLRQVFDESARPIGWLFDPIPSAAAAHMTVGVAAAPVLCWPVIAAAGPPAPPLPFLLPAAMAPAVAGPHFAWPARAAGEQRQFHQERTDRNCDSVLGQSPTAEFRVTSELHSSCHFQPCRSNAVAAGDVPGHAAPGRGRLLPAERIRGLPRDDRPLHPLSLLHGRLLHECGCAALQRVARPILGPRRRPHLAWNADVTPGARNQ